MNGSQLFSCHLIVILFMFLEERLVRKLQSRAEKLAIDKCKALSGHTFCGVLSKAQSTRGAELRPYRSSYHESYGVRSRVFPVGREGVSVQRFTKSWFASRHLSSIAAHPLRFPQALQIEHQDC
jgi:hypothetical protein